MFNGNNYYIKMKPQFKITLIYLIISLLWIYFSDKFVEQLGLSSSTLTLIQTYKGWFFVLVTSLILFYLIKKEQADLLKKEEEKRKLFKVTLQGVHHILNNFLLKMNYFKEIVSESNAVDKKTIEIFDKVIFETADELKKLSNIENPTDETVKRTVFKTKSFDV